MTVSFLLSTIQQCLARFSLDQITLAEICKFFNLTPDSVFDPNPLNTIQEKFKNKLFDIFHTEGANYTDYLTLPRFSSLKKQTQDELRTLFDMIWKEYERKVERQKKQNFVRDFEKMVPEFKTFNESSRMCRENSHNENKQAQFPPRSGMPPEFQYMRQPNSSFLMMDPQNKYNFNTFSMMNKQNDFKAVFPKVEEDPKYRNTIWADEIFLSNPSNFPIEKLQMNHQNSLIPKKDTLKSNIQQIINSHENIEKLSSFSAAHGSENLLDHFSEQIQHVAQNDENFEEKIDSYLFMECACEGNLQKPSDPYMVCRQCNFHFHHECLLMDSKNDINLCPCCKLKNTTNLFIKVHQQVYGKRWCKDMQSQKLSLVLTEREIEKLRSEKMKCKISSQIEYQLRFLKIIPKENQTKKPSTQHEGNSRKFSSIPLPAHFIQKLQPQNPFQISLKATEEDKNGKCIYFFAIFMIEKFSIQQMTQELFSNINNLNSVDQSYIKQFLRPQHQFIQIKMKSSSSLRHIWYPARGDRCSHPEVFDYLSFLEYYKEYGEKLKEKHCPICELEIDHIIVDRFILEKIRSHDENAQNDFELMKYFGNGKVQFVEEQQQEDDIDESDIVINDNENEKHESDSDPSS